MYHLVLGWIGAFLFAVCAVPQVIKTFRTKRAGDLSWLFLLFWFGGELLTFIYIVADDIIESIAHYPLYIIMRSIRSSFSISSMPRSHTGRASRSKTDIFTDIFII